MEDISSNMEIDEKKEDDSSEFLQFLISKRDPQSNASLQNAVVDIKKKGVCIPSCYLTPFHSDKIDTSCCITKKGEPSTRFCEICNEPKPAGGMKQPGKCNHYFCIDCVTQYLIENLKESRLPVECPVKESGLSEDCPEKKCRNIWHEYFNKYIPQEMLERYYVSQNMAKALASSRYVVCPCDDCGLRFLDMTNSMNKVCPKCCKVFCGNRIDEWHFGYCDRYGRRRLDKTKRGRSKCDDPMERLRYKYGYGF